MSVRIARRLRREMTDAERKLWAKLRNRRLEHSLGRYVLDSMPRTTGW